MRGAYGLVDLLCSPNAHARKGWISLVSPCARGRRHTRRGHRKWMAPFLLQHWINRTALSLLGSANLVRPRLRPDGPSNIASRHRLSDHNDRTMHPPQVAGTSSSTFLEGKTRRPISPAPEGERASLEGSLILLAIATKEKGASRVNDCQAIGGWAGGNDSAGVGWVRRYEYRRLVDAGHRLGHGSQ